MTVENILAAMPYMDEDMRQLAAAAVNKLQAMTDSEFSKREFILTDEESPIENRGAVAGFRRRAPRFYRSSKIIFFPCFCAYRSVVYAPPKSRHTIAIK